MWLRRLRKSAPDDGADLVAHQLVPLQQGVAQGFDHVPVGLDQ